MQQLIDKYPKLTFMVAMKLYWVVGFFFTIYIIQNQAPNMRQFVLGSIYTVITLPFNYYLTYNFGKK